MDELNNQDRTETSGVPLDQERTTIGWSTRAWLLREIKQAALDEETTVSGLLDRLATEYFSKRRPEVAAKIAATGRPRRGRPPGGSGV